MFEVTCCLRMNMEWGVNQTFFVGVQFGMFVINQHHSPHACSCTCQANLSDSINNDLLGN